jgi:hypothetical protein
VPTGESISITNIKERTKRRRRKFRKRNKRKQGTRNKRKNDKVDGRGR